MLSIKQGQEHIRGVLHRQEIKQNSIESAITELKQMMEKQHKAYFCLKAANLEVILYIYQHVYSPIITSNMYTCSFHSERKWFCQTMDRYPKQEHITVSAHNIHIYMPTSISLYNLPIYYRPLSAYVHVLTQRF